MCGLDESGIYEICMSDLSYEEKINLLMNQRAFAEQAIGIIDNAIFNLETGNYLEDMFKRKDELAHNMKKDKICLETGLGLCATYLVTLYPVLKHIEITNEFDYISVLHYLLLLFAFSLTITGATELKKDSKIYKSYSENLESYQRRLNK